MRRLLVRLPRRAWWPARRVFIGRASLALAARRGNGSGDGGGGGGIRGRQVEWGMVVWVVVVVGWGLVLFRTRRVGCRRRRHMSAQGSAYKVTRSCAHKGAWKQLAVSAHGAWPPSRLARHAETRAANVDVGGTAAIMDGTASVADAANPRVF